ncbi:hypothetical protein GN330_00085 [Nitratireductor sp. CAU 1489]|uniref:Uncharacterized protein n=1 Tax=Nitratireductor arenosus TaxID=2682096 RepID=A0A844Q970_9HYPH|nr:hypothetical protein [Nitratireductor arenosus]MVA95652.1 hypothetical protein [Nitratireductor arenosus]
MNSTHNDINLTARLLSELPSTELMSRAFSAAFPTEANFLPQAEVTPSEMASSIQAICKELGLDPEVIFGGLSAVYAEGEQEKTKAGVHRIQTHEEFFSTCGRELQTSRTLRVTVVGPTFLEPNWWLSRSNADSDIEPDFTTTLKERIEGGDRLQKCEIILRNNFERYSDNLSEYVSGKTEWKKLISEMKGSMKRLFGQSGEKGPRIRCFDPGFLHLPHIFDDTVLIGTRATPRHKVRGGWKITDPEHVANEIERWTSMFHTYPQTQSEAVAKLRLFMEELENGYKE